MVATPYRILLVSSTRADLGYLRFVIKALQKNPNFKIIVTATCMHLAASSGKTIREFEELGIEVDEKVEMLLDSDSPAGIAKSMGMGILGFADLLDRVRPQAVMVMGDRFEILSVAAACLPFAIPVIHFSGGDLTEGVIDDAIRHAVTKLSHFHFPATEVHAKRLQQMGEESWRIRAVGEPALEFLSQETLLTKKELEKDLGFALEDSTLLVTFHPETLEAGDSKRQVAILTQTLSKLSLPTIITGPNVDTGSSVIRETLKNFAKQNPKTLYVENLGHKRYLSLLQFVGALLGNSSSGIVEAPSFSLPVVNLGTRQNGRIKGVNIIDTPIETERIMSAVEKALSGDFKKTLVGMQNPYGDGNTSARVEEALLEWIPRSAEALHKKFTEK
ncbi:MAG: UDP-N-acetylglucosamine 2-epimerase [Deltaproteobacteria bacterium]|nr:UDP-N-acetylglucosamine 2-epimerase [Deltaproteobacteria bacterium]